MSDDLVKQLRELASRTHDINDHTSLHLSADEIERLCALLAFRPPAEDVRREALEEAAKLLDKKAEAYHLYGERAFKEGDEKHAAEMWGHHATLWDAAAAIREMKT